MGERRFLLVDSSALPDVFLKVLQAKELLASGSVSNISTAAAYYRTNMAFPAVRSISTRTMCLTPKPAARPLP